MKRIVLLVLACACIGRIYAVPSLAEAKQKAAELAEKAKESAQRAGSAISTGAKKAGSAIAAGAQQAQEAAKKAGSAITSGAQKIGSSIAQSVQKMKLKAQNHGENILASTAKALEAIKKYPADVRKRHEEIVAAERESARRQSEETAKLWALMMEHYASEKRRLAEESQKEKRLAREANERVRLARDAAVAVKERLAREAAEKERLAKEATERERLAAEKNLREQAEEILKALLALKIIYTQAEMLTEIASSTFYTGLVRMDAFSKRIVKAQQFVSTAEAETKLAAEFESNLAAYAEAYGDVESLAIERIIPNDKLSEMASLTEQVGSYYQTMEQWAAQEPPAEDLLQLLRKSAKLGI